MKPLKLLIILLFVAGCAGKGENTGNTTSPTTLSDTNRGAENAENNFQPEQEKNFSLDRHIEFLKEEWSNVPNPVEVTFRGAEFGDYFHLMFETPDGKWLDFGDGNNTLGSVKLYSEDLESNPNLEGKQFKIYWEWKESSFNCCEGMMEPVTAKVPSINRIEPVK